MFAWFLLVLAPFVIGLLVLALFVIGTLLAGGTVLEGAGLFFGSSVALLLFKTVFGNIMQAKEDRRDV